jgi:transcriptional regulator with XRE-family HTH domain
MKFGDKLQIQRKKNSFLQEDVAREVGITTRTLQNYEAGVSYPKDRSIYFKLAEFFNVDVNYFLTENEDFLMEAAAHFGKRGREQASAILEQAAAMFAGGELSEEEQIAFLHEMQGLFLDSKKRAKAKYTAKKHK